MPRQRLSRVEQSLGNKPQGDLTPPGLSSFYECQAHLIIHITQRPRDNHKLSTTGKKETHNVSLVRGNEKRHDNCASCHLGTL